MPKITLLNVSTAVPKEQQWQETLTFIANDGSEATFSNPQERRMGAYWWDLSIQRQGNRQRVLTQYGLSCLDVYQPWSSDSERLFIAAWDGNSYLYVVGSGEVVKCETEGYVQSAVSSFLIPRFLVSSDKGTFIVKEDGSGELLRDVRKPAYGIPQLFWLSNAGVFFSVENLGNGRARLVFFSIETLKERASISLDPIELVPYDEARYVGLSRASFSLALSKSTRCVGSLLDCWSRFHFDERQQILTMCILRPTGDVYESKGALLCPAEEKWVRIRVDFE